MTESKTEEVRENTFIATIILIGIIGSII